jgi:hypothetical protein
MSPKSAGYGRTDADEKHGSEMHNGRADKGPHRSFLSVNTGADQAATNKPDEVADAVPTKR